MKSQVAQTRHGPIEYTVLGNGPAVLICHGTSSDCHFTEIAQRLAAAGFKAVTPSRPGYGRTPLEVGRTAAEAAEAFMALLEGLSIQTCSVVAISGGGPTGVALAARFPQRVERLVLIAAVTRPENRANEPAYQDQTAFYGPMHAILWRALGLVSTLSPQRMARQTLATFSSHDPDDGLSRLSREDIDAIRRFYQGNSSRHGALTDATHTVGKDVLKEVCQPTLVIHSREDKSVLFSHAEWAMTHIPVTELCESGFTGHFFWIGPDYPRVSQHLVRFLSDGRES